MQRPHVEAHDPDSVPRMTTSCGAGKNPTLERFPHGPASAASWKALRESASDRQPGPNKHNALEPASHREVATFGRPLHSTRVGGFPPAAGLD
jgi:hypothetical protein